MEERTEIIVLLESIKNNILHNPGKKVWAGVVLFNSKEYYWKITEKPLGILIKEKK
jgi:hypothetical protein